MVLRETWEKWGHKDPWVRKVQLVLRGCQGSQDREECQESRVILEMPDLVVSKGSPAFLELEVSLEKMVHLGQMVWMV